MEMYFCPLYSGSSGNALFVQCGATRLLIDAGRTGREIGDAMRTIGASPETLSGILITHEHSDHIKAAGILARRYGIPVYATSGTWRAMAEKIGTVRDDLRREIAADTEFSIGSAGLVPFRIPHDAAEPVGYRIFGGHRSVSVATDLGHFSGDVYRYIAGSDLILLESNHDPEMLKHNPNYNAQLKRRILGDRGHLSNQACAEALSALLEGGTRHVILGHLSGENNTPELAMSASMNAMESAGIRVGKDIEIDIAMRDRTGSVYRIAD
ncbi:MAG: MBL fold metallo-hydrolase [Clostridia bacterium]|nr:MBL fold metallo-hydrolase [Clostridia bacterium]